MDEARFNEAILIFPHTFNQQSYRALLLSCTGTHAHTHARAHTHTHTPTHTDRQTRFQTK